MSLPLFSQCFLIIIINLRHSTMSISCMNIGSVKIGLNGGLSNREATLTLIRPNPIRLPLGNRRGPVLNFSIWPLAQARAYGLLIGLRLRGRPRQCL